jgi:hypothetical protein
LTSGKINKNRFISNLFIWKRLQTNSWDDEGKTQQIAAFFLMPYPIIPNGTTRRHLLHFVQHTQKLKNTKCISPGSKYV